jgi:hypothetical protein
MTVVIGTNAVLNKDAASIISKVGSISRTQAEKNAESLSVKDFGAVGDGTLHTVQEWINAGRFANLSAIQTTYPFVTSTTYSIDLLAFNAALAYLASSRTNADSVYMNQRGLGAIRVPKGAYYINGSITTTSPLNLIFEGDGAESSVLLYTLDTGVCFDIQTYTYYQLSNIGIIHKTATAKNTWTNTCFKLNGNGGGREFSLNGCVVYGFDRTVSHTNTINEDTNSYYRCTFSECNTFLYARNSQAIGSNFIQCTWSGNINRVFDVSGFGFTHIDTANIVVSGTFLYLASGNAGTASQYTITNAKFEFEPKGGAIGTSKVIETEDSQSVSAYVRFNNCGISGGTPLSTVNQFDIKCGSIILEVDGGQWANTKISTKAQTLLGNINSSWIRFKNCASAPSTTITRVAGLAGSMHFPVIFENCKDVANVCLKGSGLANNLASSGVGLDRNVNTKNANGYVAFSNVDQLHSFPTYGQPVVVDRIRVVISSKAGLLLSTIKAYADSALTVQIGSTIIIPDGTTSTASVFEVSVPAGTITSNGVYVVVTNTNVNGAAAGSVFVDTTSF